MYRRPAQGWSKHWDFILVDLLALLLSFILAYAIRLGQWTPFANTLYRTLGFVVLLMDLIAAIAFNTFSGVLKHGYYRLFVDCCRHALLVMLFNILFTFATQVGEAYSRLIVFTTAGFHLFLGYGTRLLYRKLRHSRRRDRLLFLITTSDCAKDAIESLRGDITNSIQIEGMAIIDCDMVDQEVNGIPVVANRDTVISYLTREWVDEVFFQMPRQNDEYERLFEALLETGVTLHMNIGMLDAVKNQKQEVERIGKSLVLTIAINTISGFNAIGKRILDILGGLVGSVIALIVMACVVIPIKRISPGPLLYTSERIGRNGKRFKMYKIRTMIPEAEIQKASLMKENRLQDGRMFKLTWDPRVIGNITMRDGNRKTGIGEFLRRTSLDETPQFFNVLKGNMSLVGTRPPTPDEWAKYETHHRARMSTKPGITGMWQVSGRSEIIDFEEVVRLDMEYITNWSFGLDIKLLLKTIVAVVKGKGAL